MLEQDVSLLKKLSSEKSDVADLKNTSEAGLAIKKKNTLFFQLCLGALMIVVFLLGVMFFHFQHELSSIKKKQHWLRKGMASLKHEIISDTQFLLKSEPSLPYMLASLPLADSNGIILNSKIIEIRDMIAPYNGSIIENGSGYLCFFRYDTPYFNESLDHIPSKPLHANAPYNLHERLNIPYDAHIGVVELDSNFNQTNKEYITINTGTHTSEDPRIVSIGDETYLIYNDLKSNDKARCMHIANINMNDFSVKFKTKLDLDMNHFEKNWSPFEYKEEDSAPQLMFEYHISPHKIFTLPKPQINDLHPLLFAGYTSPHALPWNEQKWGPICGGTPAQKIGDEYLGFFHSHFVDMQKNIWYVMGAYTFSATPPFKITSISSDPIMFKDIYHSKHDNGAYLSKRVIFPSGFVIRKENGKEVIHLSCGENDSCIKVLTLDKNLLLKSLKRIKI
jgi:predicted GH43/DUF377 family glycosyl hydrolase